jgi:exosortase
VGVGAGRAGASDAARLMADPTSLTKAGLVVLGLVGLFWIFIYQQHRHSWGSADWSHAYFVPLISGWLLWQKKDELARVRFGAFWPGLLCVLLAVVCYAFFLVGAMRNHLGQGLSFLLAVFGVSLMLLGPRAMPVVFFPIAYLGFAITVPEKLMNYVTYPLQDLAAWGGWLLLRMLGYDVDLTGNVLHMILKDGSSHPLNVAEQCNGMRMVVGFLALGAAVALVAVRTWWKRVVLVAIAVPIALLVNIVRVGVLGMLSLVSPDLAVGEAHMWIGTALLVPGFFLFMGVLKALNVAVPEAAASKGGA